MGECGCRTSGFFKSRPGYHICRAVGCGPAAAGRVVIDQLVCFTVMYLSLKKNSYVLV